MLFRRLRAFTLIEMLVVLAIIGILAGILLPALAMARAKARVTQASNDIAQIRTSLMAYVQDYGANPPDGMGGLEPTVPGNPIPSPSWPAGLSPNECLVWFITRTFSKDISAAGCPWYTATWAPASAIVVYSRVPGGPYASWSQKQLQDFNQNGYKEFVDPWGRPYMYRAYPRSYALGAVSAAGGKGTYVIADANVQNLAANVGRVRITGCANSGNNGTFDIEATGANTFTVVNAGASNEAAGAATVQFLLHNPDECDIYSLGPNGLTRSADRPLPVRDNGMGTEWKPADIAGSQFGKWVEVWGTPGDGNDVNSQSGNPGIASDKDKDDINNWK